MENTILLLGIVTVTISANPLRIFNGTDDKYNKYPYVVSIETWYSQVRNESVHRLCSGSLITHSWVLSAGHCMVPHATVIRYGDMTTSRKNMTFTIAIKVLPHPNYVDRTSLPYMSGLVVLENDIGLIKILATQLRVLAKVSAVHFGSLYGLEAEYAGYGNVYSTEGKDWLKNVIANNKSPLQLGRGLIIACPGNESIIKVNPSICLARKCSDMYHDSGPGDSGGPVFVRGRIVAVISSGYGYRKLTILTPVSAYLEWIQQQVNLKKSKKLRTFIPSYNTTIGL